MYQGGAKQKEEAAMDDWRDHETIRKKRRWTTLKKYNNAENSKRYSKIKKETKNMIRNAKRRLEKNLASRLDKNYRKFARYIKTKTKSHSTSGPLLAANKRLITDNKEMAEELNKYFASVFTRESTGNIPEAEKENVTTPMPQIEVTRDKIKEKIKELRMESAPGLDGLTPRMLKELGGSILVPFEVLFKKSLRSGEVPDAWRTATVMPIFKKGTKGNPGNYRPVSLTSVP
jgi:hypothetical protein